MQTTGTEFQQCLNVCEHHTCKILNEFSICTLVIIEHEPNRCDGANLFGKLPCHCSSCPEEKQEPEFETVVLLALALAQASLLAPQVSLAQASCLVALVVQRA